MIVVAGAMGQPGTAVRERLGDDGRCLDLRWVIDELQPAVVINCAAYGRTKLEGERRAPDANPDTVSVDELALAPLPGFHGSLEQAIEILGRRS